MMTHYKAFQLNPSCLLFPLFIAGVLAASTAAQAQDAQTSTPAAKATTRAGQPSHYSPNRFPARATALYSSVWGVDSFSVKAVESGELIRFSYRVVDEDRAKVINDKKNEPYLISQQKHVKLVIPSLEKVGQLRQSSAPIAGNTYWMAFSNPGRPVKPGDRVDIEIGQFHVQGLLVQ